MYKRDVEIPLSGLMMILIVLLFPAFMEKTMAQAELQAWGNLSGIRIEGELMPIESSLRIVGNNWSQITETGKEKQHPKFNRKGDSQIVATHMGSIALIETVTDLESGKVALSVRSTVNNDTAVAGIFLCVHLAEKDYPQALIRFGKDPAQVISSLQPDSLNVLTSAVSTELDVKSKSHQLRIKWKDPVQVYVRKSSSTNEGVDIYMPVQVGNLHAGQTEEKTFTLQASGTVDKKDIQMTLNTGNPGRSFKGFGGNFRIQNLKADPQVIDYCLKNMRVAWGRVEMPWRFWQPEKNTNPIAAAKNAGLEDHVKRAMEMAQKLQQIGMPIILTDWFAPDWAITGKLVFFHKPGGEWGNPLNPDSTDAIYQSIADYIQYVKDAYGVEIGYFSFNESDLGINVRQTGEEHNELIKGLGKYFLSRGLKTKMLLGDNSDATTYTFIDPAIRDAASHPYIGAISFHSWRGWETETLMHWTSASQQLNLPLIVGEGSIDAAAWAYPEIFLEQTYAMQEISLYIRLMAICQPITILQWQLTSDYSPLTGGGVFGKEGPLQPTQRFWNLKQLASTPPDLQYLQINSNASNVTCAALGDVKSGKYVIHIVNNGAKRKLILDGLPASVLHMKIISTSKSQSMEEGKPLAVNKGKVVFDLPAGCFTTVTTD